MKIIEEMSLMYPIVLLCFVMGVNHSGYYRWKTRKDTPNCYRLNRAILTTLIKDEHQIHKVYGYHRPVVMVRKRTNISFSDNLIHKCCKYENIRSPARRYRYNKPSEEHYMYENTVRNRRKTHRPLIIVAGGMTCFLSKGKNYEWTYMIDAYSNRIIAFRVSEKSGTSLITSALIHERTDKGADLPWVLHTDQASVYSSRAFSQAHKGYNIIRSMSRVGTPTDNAKIESLNGWIKEELYKDFDFYHTDDVYELIEKYIQYSNYDRPQFALNNKTPVQFELIRGVSKLSFFIVYFVLICTSFRGR